MMPNCQRQQKFHLEQATQKHCVYGVMLIAFCTLQNSIQILQTIILMTPENTCLHSPQAEEE